MSTAIKVSNLSKKYRIYHEKQLPHGTLKEKLYNQIKAGCQRLRHPLNKDKRETSNYEEFWALQDINIEMEQGDRIGIVGRNGAGKSTLLKVLARIIEPTSGQIKIRGKMASLLEVGTGFHPDLSGRENIFLNGAILGMKQQEMKKRFDQIVAFAEIDQFLDTPVKRYSSGMYTRLGFAIAAHLDPDILIVDEVLAVGDLQFQEKCTKKLNDLGSKGRTVIFVSHNTSSLLNICNKGFYLEKGRVKESGTIEQCVNSYMRHEKVLGLNWEGNEGDEHIRFYQALVKLPNVEREFFYQGEKVLFHLDYDVLHACEDMVLGITICDQRSRYLAHSHITDDISHSKFIQPGRHRATFEIDTGLFHEGEYILNIDCILHNRKVILDGHIKLKFQIFINNKQTRFKVYPNEGIYLGNRWTTALV